MQTYQKKPSEQTQTQTQNNTLSHLTEESGAIPNSAMLSMMRIANGNDDARQENSADVAERMSNLRENILSRMFSTPIRPQAQIPRAEAEADRLSANISAASPEGVKRDLGRRMDADFSGVRFHTDAGAVAKADAMGARAFTSGADVYFGEGGFDPAVAAHELVHTAQQGMVAAGVETMATPVGGVQMLSTSVSRKYHDTINATYEAMTKPREENGGKTDWEMLSEDQKKSWQREHPIAYHKAQKAIEEKAKGKTKAADKIEKRIQKRQQELDAANAFLAGRAPKKTSMLTKDEGGNWQIGAHHATDKPTETEETSAHEILDQASEATDSYVGTPSGVAGSTLGALSENIGGSGLNVGNSVLSGFNGGLNMVQGGYGVVNDSMALAQAIREKDTGGIVDSSLSLTGNASSVISGAADVASLAGGVAGTVGGVISGGAGIVSGGVNIALGAREIHQGRKKTKAMKEIQKDLGDRETLEGNDLLLRDTAEQARKEGVRQQTEGSGKVVTGALDATAGALQTAGALVPVAAGGTAVAGAVLSGVSTATKVGFAIENHRQENAMEADVIEQTLGITEKDIKDFQKAYNIKNPHRAKQALMKAMGYTTGQRREAYADQTEKRGEYFAEQAAAGNEQAQTMMKGLGVKASQTGEYDAAAAAQSMGLRQSRGKILKKADGLGTKIRQARSDANAQKASKK